MSIKRHFRNILCVAAVAVLFAAMTAVDASAASKSISQLREEKARYEQEKKELNERIETIEFERLAELEKKELLDERMILTGLEISNLEETIRQYNLLISEKEYEIIIAQNREEEQLDRYKARVRFLEESGTASYLEVIFESASFVDLIARIDFVSSIIRADEDAYVTLQQARETTEEAKGELEEIKTELDLEIEKVEALRLELDMQLKEAHALILKMESDLEQARELYEVASEEENRVQKEIRAYEAQLAAQRRAAAQAAAAAAAQGGSSEQSGEASEGGNSSGGGSEAAAPVSGTGELMWPVSGPIISNYGQRSGRMHQGIDISAANGTTIVAADGGKVITSTYGSGYGNYVVISHGNGMTTLYAHLSSRAVSVGDTVSKGQKIGAAGSTGNASCSHLHFEVSIDGSRIDPLKKL